MFEEIEAAIPCDHKSNKRKGIAAAQAAIAVLNVFMTVSCCDFSKNMYAIDGRTQNRRFTECWMI